MQKRPSAMRFITENLGWMLGSLILAALVWYAAVSAQNPVEQRRFPQRVTIAWQLDPGLLIANKSTSSVEVTVRALQSVWAELEADDISIVADLRGYGPGTYTVEPKGSLPDVYGGSVVRIQPGRVTVEIARREEKRVNVVVRFTQDAPVGFVATATPASMTVLVSGPEASVQQVESVQAQVSLLEQRTSFTQDVPLVAIDASNRIVNGVVIEPAVLAVSVEIQQRPDVTELAVDPRLVGELPPGYLRRNYNWEPKRIIVRGDQAIIEQLGGVVSTDPIDLTGRTQTFTQTVKLTLPPGVTMLDPKDITVTVEIEPVLLSREFANIPIIIQGLDPADYNITLHPDRVNVIVTGPQVLVDALTASDISVFAPLGGLSAGTHIVSLEASIATSGLTREHVTIPNNQVEVTIVARNPTLTPTTGPTRTPTPTATPGPD